MLGNYVYRIIKCGLGKPSAPYDNSHANIDVIVCNDYDNTTHDNYNEYVNEMRRYVCKKCSNEKHENITYVDLRIYDTERIIVLGTNMDKEKIDCFLQSTERIRSEFNSLTDLVKEIDKCLS